MLFLNKKKLFQLDRRLQTCASMVRENHVLADIGTDHAYLPIWLVKKEVIKRQLLPISIWDLYKKRHLTSDATMWENRWTPGYPTGWN